MAPAVSSYNGLILEWIFSIPGSSHHLSARYVYKELDLRIKIKESYSKL